MAEKEKDQLEELSKEIGKIIESNRKLVSRIMDEDFQEEEEGAPLKEAEEHEEEEFEEL